MSGHRLPTEVVIPAALYYIRIMNRLLYEEAQDQNTIQVLLFDLTDKGIIHRSATRLQNQR